MRFQTLKQKFMALAVIAFAFFCVISYGYVTTTRSAAKAAVTSAVSKQDQTLMRLLALSDKSFNLMIFDLTYWDELVDFVKSPQKKWIEDNVIPSLEKQQVATLEIYDPEWRRVYFSQVGAQSLTGLSKESIAELQSRFNRKNPFYEFTYWLGGDLVHVKIAGIFRGDDSSRKGRLYGFFACQKIINSVESLKLLGSISGTEVSSELHDEKFTSRRLNDGIQTRIPVKGLDGEPIADLVFDSTFDQVVWSSSRSERDMVVFLAMLLAAFVLFGFILHYKLLRPISRLTSAIRSDSTSDLEQFGSDKDEIGTLAAAANELQESKHELAALNEELVDTMAQLEKSNSNLSLLNQTLEDRILARTKDLEQAVDATILGWSMALEARDQDTTGHTNRVTQMALRIGQEMGLNASQLRTLELGSMLHDIGKIGIPDAILLKEGPLTPLEFELMKTHTVIGYEMLKDIPFLKDCLPIPLSHHERWDGTGYPHGISSIEIPFLARIFSVADVWDALRSNRPYRKSWSESATRLYIQENAGTQFDPSVVEAFLTLPALAHPSDEATEAAA